MKVKALIPTGLGFNCEYESAKAFEMAGAESTIVDIRDIIDGDVNIFDYDVIMLIGGFSYGDDLGSGKAIANLLRFKKINGERFIDLIKKFVVDEKKVVLGICNGFQVLIKLGILPGFDENYEDQNSSLALNDSGRYEDRWVNLKFNSESNCIATKGIDEMYIPVRHGEGKIIANDDVMEKIMDNNQYIAQYINPETKKIAVKYPINPNGSTNAIAGLSDETGRIFGLMPHPEANLLFENHPHWTRLKRDYEDKGMKIPEHGDGLKIFKNIVEYLEGVKK
ncbi:phosphoribosylformylglycinamidine synthase subunit PurQ [archaeon]|jgi:phosphoribosylformylglycinamidine synthase subunit PurQ / glutaminase|nr:phosphoribosylformylglycinamidine synthase subunit PurQ [archaeon]MBT4352776.1 phosphoribosylformylglycinamidine synthase subunit PurQ [archaeon]MBT4647714.1 phosphoribosylformylglycinamidine synthase subunit PurQ [archaeon]MBT6822667.1 phosphoribosylformylglycinamidine synthase subunit PurQ [archaeon]MBT7392410.1 phosphoribosylformylglycinamidine synthase subunit PurQ [archaeon]